MRGAYFNQIAREWKASTTGTTFARVLERLSQLHSYLSSPTGGGVRHGADLAAAIGVSVDEARLYVNLILSYVTYLRRSMINLNKKPARTSLGLNLFQVWISVRYSSHRPADMSEITNEMMVRAAEAKKAGDLAAARDLVIAAVPLLRQESARMPLAYALRELGEVERALPGTDGGVGSYREAVAILREEDGGPRLAHAIRHLGDIYRHAGEWAEAEHCYREALDLYRAHREVPPLELANALRSAALLKESVAQHDEAINLWEEAHRLYVSAGIAVAVEETSRRLARLRSQ